MNKRKILNIVGGIILAVIILIGLSIVFNWYPDDKSKDNPENVGNNENKVDEVDLNNALYFLESQLDVTIFEDIEPEKYQTLMSEIKVKVVDLEDKISKHKKNSDVLKINKNAGIKPVKVSRETLEIIKASIKYSKLSDGLFDVTVGNLVSIWGIDTDFAKVPSEEEINNALNTIDYRKIQIDEKNMEVYLTEKGMQLDLGGIAKGYIVDEISEMIKEAGIKSAIINISGNINLIGNKSGELFKVGIRDPYGLRNDIVGVYSGENKTVVTSGVYERVFYDENTGNNYHHILSTKDGYPIQNGLQSVSIITDKSVDGDALSTTLFALGMDKALEIANNTENLDVIFITDDREVYLSEGIKNNFEIINNEYAFGNNM